MDRSEDTWGSRKPATRAEMIDKAEWCAMRAEVFDSLVYATLAGFWLARADVSTTPLGIQFPTETTADLVEAREILEQSKREDDLPMIRVTPGVTADSLIQRMGKSRFATGYSTVELPE